MFRQTSRSGDQFAKGQVGQVGDGYSAFMPLKVLPRRYLESSVMFEGAADDKYLFRIRMKFQRQVEGAALIAAINNPGDAGSGSNLSWHGRLDGKENNGNVREQFIAVLEQEPQRMVDNRNDYVD